MARAHPHIFAYYEMHIGMDLRPAEYLGIEMVLMAVAHENEQRQLRAQ